MRRDILVSSPQSCDSQGNHLPRFPYIILEWELSKFSWVPCRFPGRLLLLCYPASAAALGGVEVGDALQTPLPFIVTSWGCFWVEEQPRCKCLGMMEAEDHVSVASQSAVAFPMTAWRKVVPSSTEAPWTLC